MANSYETTETDIEIARFSITLQANAHNLNLEDPNIKAFIEHSIKVRAADLAGIRFYSFKCGERLTQTPEDVIAGNLKIERCTNCSGSGTTTLFESRRDCLVCKGKGRICKSI